MPYADSDTFSSGALIHSLSSNKIVIGPSLGNFLDLNKQGACLVYENFTDLFSIIRPLLADQSYYNAELTKLRKGISNYYKLNSWENFIDELLLILRENKTALSGKKMSWLLSN